MMLKSAKFVLLGYVVVGALLAMIASSSTILGQKFFGCTASIWNNSEAEWAMSIFGVVSNAVKIVTWAPSFYSWSQSGEISFWSWLAPGLDYGCAQARS